MPPQPRMERTRRPCSPILKPVITLTAFAELKHSLHMHDTWNLNFANRHAPYMNINALVMRFYGGENEI
eukprot:1160629-Pelagomonas_calceolata.AAC.10